MSTPVLVLGALFIAGPLAFLLANLIVVVLKRFAQKRSVSQHASPQESPAALVVEVAKSDTSAALAEIAPLKETGRPVALMSLTLKARSGKAPSQDQIDAVMALDKEKAA